MLAHVLLLRTSPLMDMKAQVTAPCPGSAGRATWPGGCRGLVANGRILTVHGGACVPPLGDVQHRLGSCAYRGAQV